MGRTWRMTPVIIRLRIIGRTRTIITRIHTITARLITVRATTTPGPFTATGTNLRRAVG